MEYLDVISRWVHIGTAIVIVGGSVFKRFVLIPSAADLTEDTRDSMKGRVASRWKMFVHIGILLFILSGGYNYFKAMQTHKGMPLYHALIGTKILLALVVFFLLSVLVGRSPKFESMRKNSGKWMLLTILLAAVIIGISGYAKVKLPGHAPAPVTPEGEDAPSFNLEIDTPSLDVDASGSEGEGAEIIIEDPTSDSEGEETEIIIEDPSS